MKQTLALFVLILSMAVGHSHAQGVTSVPAEMTGGFPVANFAISAQVPSDGSGFGHVWANTGRLGGWLNDLGALPLTLKKGNSVCGLDTFAQKSLSRDFPVIENVYVDKKQFHSRLTLQAFCPIEMQDADETALPVIMLQLDVEGLGDDSYDLQISPQNPSLLQVFSADSVCRDEQGGVVIPVTVRKGTTKRFRLAVVHYDETWASAQRFSDSRDIANYVLPRYDVLLQHTRSFRDALPHVGDDRIDPYLQYYMLPAMVLTRINRDGQVLTMGYCELNQRDSFWTTWMHLVMFHELEWKMIAESYQAMRPSGKIPTCLLPEIERWDDLDINLFLILRTARYYAMYHDVQRLRQVWSDACRVMDWVVGRDLEHVGIPQQVSFWGDWKDVRYMQDRKYSPFVAMLYLAALDQMQRMAQVCGDAERHDYYARLYSQSFERVNRDISQGGLWNGHYYDQVWKDGSARGLLCQDQMVGVLYDVIPTDRACSIADALNQLALTPYGICNQYPYLPDVEYPEATYHNGAMWPWLSFMDCWARLRMGRSEEAIDLLQRIFRADIVDSGDYVPNEHINTLTGENLGFPVQGWNANLFGLVYFGLLYPSVDFKLH